MEIYNFLTIILIGAAVFLLLVHFAFRLDDFKSELKYVNMEIHRTEGNQRKYWKRKRRKLWLSFIFFIR